MTIEDGARIVARAMTPQEENVLWEHLSKAHEAISNAQHWADTWKAHAFEMKEALADAEQQLTVLRPGGLYAWKSRHDRLLLILRDIVKAWEGAEWCDEAVKAVRAADDPAPARRFAP